MMDRVNRWVGASDWRGGGKRKGLRANAGLTLIDLLVSVTIIAILALVALPNLLVFQTRAKVAASRNSLRIVANAIDAYHIDHHSYPFPQASTDDPFGVVARGALKGLTTPVAYVGSDAFRDAFGQVRVQVVLSAPDTGLFSDPFRSPTPSFNSDQSVLYFYYPSLVYLLVEPVPPGGAFAVVSVGPDLKDSFAVYYPFPRSLPRRAALYGINSVADSVYDPTNGTISGGDLAAFGGALAVPRFIGGGN
jgi:type II secretory pathway pseudopilin PulG